LLNRPIPSKSVYANRRDTFGILLSGQAGRGASGVGILPIGTADLSEFRDQLAAKGLKPATIDRINSVFKAATEPDGRK
jgi:hypothetical protein